MQNQIARLENRVTQLENQIDDIIIVGGPALPTEPPNENSSAVIVRCIKDNLHINISQTDISVAHRMETKRTQNTNRPIIVKLQSRQKKSEIMIACITVKPNLHVNERLASKRRSLFIIIWDIIKQYRDLFQQSNTQDEKYV